MVSAAARTCGFISRIIGGASAPPAPPYATPLFSGTCNLLCTFSVLVAFMIEVVNLHKLGGAASQHEPNLVTYCLSQRNSLFKEEGGKICHPRRLKLCQVYYTQPYFLLKMLISDLILLGPSTETEALVHSTSSTEGNFMLHITVEMSLYRCVHGLAFCVF